LAAQATQDQFKRIEKIKKAAEVQRLKDLKEVEELAKRLEGVTVTLKGKVAPSGKYYGAITNAQVAEGLGKLTDREIERRLVEMPEPIHEPGAYTAVVRLHTQVASNINVVAEAEE
jgi:large subunit ribosomal protein L9